MIDDRRKYPREPLAAALVCVCRSEGGMANFLLRNISLDGMLLERAEGMDISFLSTGDTLTLCDVLLGPKSLFTGVAGTIVWLHEPFVGLHLSSLLMDSPAALRAWLGAHRLI